MNPFTNEDEDLDKHQEMTPSRSPPPRPPMGAPPRPAGPPPPRPNGPPGASPPRPPGPPGVPTEVHSPSVSPPLPPPATEAPSLPQPVNISTSSNDSPPPIYQDPSLRDSYDEEKNVSHSNPLRAKKVKSSPPPPSDATPSPIKKASMYEQENDEDDGTINPISSKATNKEHSSRISPPPPQPTLDHNENTERLSIQLEKTKDNMANLGGLNPLLKSQIEIPNEILSRVLFAQEKVVGCFDTFFPSNKWSTRTEFFVSLFTLGMYQVYLFFVYIVRCFRHLLCKCEPCQDKVDFQRGKMVITSFGRLLYWDLQVHQTPCLDQKAHHIMRSNLKIFKVEDIAEINLGYSDHYLFANCCYRDYRTGVDITFNHFRNDPPIPSFFLSTYSVRNYISTIASYITSTFLASKSMSQPYLLPQSTPFTIRLLSNPDDHIYSGDYGIEPLEDLIKFHHHVMSLLPSTSIFCRPKDVIDPKLYAQLGDDVIGILPGIKELEKSSTLFHHNMMDAVGQISVSVGWIGQLPGEEIVAGLGQPVAYTWLDTFLTIATFGMYHLCYSRYYHSRKTFFIITTKRIIEIILYNKKAEITSDLQRITFSMRSLFPHSITSGSLISDKTRLHSYLLSSYGTIHMNIPANQLKFALKLQLIESRAEGLCLGKENASFTSSFADETKQIHRQTMDKHAQNQLSSNSWSILHHSIPSDAISSPQLNTTNNNQLLTFINEQNLLNCTQLTSLDRMILPLLPEEDLIYRYQSSFSFRNPGSWLVPFTSLANWLQCCCYICGPLNRVNSNQAIVTNHSMYYVSYGQYYKQVKDSYEQKMNSQKNLNQSDQQQSNLDDPSSNSEQGEAHIEHGHKKHHMSSKNINLSEISEELEAESLYVTIPTVLRRKTQSSNISNTNEIEGSNLELRPFVMIWLPLSSIKNQQMEIIAKGADPYYETCCFETCKLQATSEISEYHHVIETNIGLTLPFTQEIPFHAWIKDTKSQVFMDLINMIMFWNQMKK